ncbi:zinc-binding dehydrogenase [candidate division GN15 bacterium]|nr:zinc-binding dehydrogenase [candidate division GN15 bacterium]
MKAVIYTRYGPPEVLSVQEVDKPSPKGDEVLIKVHASTTTATDCIFRRGKPLISRGYTGLFRPKHRTPGDELAGEIAAAGHKVTRFKEGDAIVATTGGVGANAEYICLSPEKATVAIKPSNLSYEEAAGSCDGFLTALPFLRDTGQLKEGQRLVVIGASGSVGSAAVQLARYLGAEVTGICSAVNVDLVRSLGAHNVIDYTQEDFTQNGKTYDVIFDTVGRMSFSRCKKSLTKNGVLLEASIRISVLPTVLWTGVFGSKKARIAATGMRPPPERTTDLEFIRSLLESGDLVPVIDRTYVLDNIVEAHRYVDTGHKKGNVVITMDHTAK